MQCNYRRNNIYREVRLREPDRTHLRIDRIKSRSPRIGLLLRSIYINDTGAATCSIAAGRHRPDANLILQSANCQRVIREVTTRPSNRGRNST